MRAATITVREPVRHRLDEKPWYRQFWPWFLITLLALSVALSGGVLYAAVHGADDVVPHDGDSTSYSAPQAPEHARPHEAAP